MINLLEHSQCKIETYPETRAEKYDRYGKYISNSSVNTWTVDAPIEPCTLHISHLHNYSDITEQRNYSLGKFHVIFSTALLLQYIITENDCADEAH